MSRRKDIPCACGETAAKNKSIKKINNIAGDPNGDFEIIAGNGLSINQSGDSQVTIGGRPVTQYDDGLMTSEDKIKLENVQNVYATKEQVDNVQLSVNDKVSRRGDTMTGLLNAKAGVDTKFTRLLDTRGFQRAFTVYNYDDNQSVAELHTQITTSNGTVIYPALKLFALVDGSYFATLTSSILGVNDDSDKIMTIKMANRLPSLVHTNGSEDIYGFKKFLNNIALKNDATKSLTFSKADGTEAGYISITGSGDMWIKSSSGKLTLEAPNGTANAPATPSNATGKEIATAEWVRALINQFAAANGLNGI